MGSAARGFTASHSDLFCPSLKGAARRGAYSTALVQQLVVNRQRLNRISPNRPSTCNGTCSW